jgi:O-antigen ligase
MKKNMGSSDRVIRLILAIGIAILYLTGTISGTLGLVLLLAGGIFLATSFINFCPLYGILGVSTRKKE